MILERKPPGMYKWTWQVPTGNDKELAVAGA